MEKELLKAFGQMTYGIYILTSKFEDEINGMVASWVTQVSYDPPLILVAIHPNRYSHNLLEKSHVFALHVLDSSQKGMLKRFKGSDIKKKFSDIPWELSKTGVPILKNCLAWFELKVTGHLTPGNHTLFIGKVVNNGTESKGNPLCTLEYQGKYIGEN